MLFESFHSSSSGNMYRVSAPGRSPLLIECGVPLRKIREALDYRLSDVCGCLVSHSHADHSMAASDLMGAGIDCYMSLDTAEELRLSGHRLHIIESLKSFDAGPWRCVPFFTEHDCPGSLGFLISDGRQRLLFATDTYYVRPRFRNLNIIAIECNWSQETLAPDLDPVIKKRLLRSHMSLDTCRAFLRAQDMRTVREIHLIHISRTNGDPELFRREIQRTTGKPTYACKEKS